MGGALAIAAVGGVVGYAAAQPRHQPTAQVFVSNSSISAAPDLKTGARYLHDATNSFASVATTPIVLTAVIKKFGLHTAPAQFAQRVTTSVPSDTTLIDISVAGSSPLESARLANAVAEELVKVSSDLSPSSAGTKLHLTQVKVAHLTD